MNKKFTFVSWKWGLFFLKKGNPILLIKLGQRLPKSFSQLHVKNSRFYLSYFMKKDDWPKAYAGPRLPTLPYRLLLMDPLCSFYLQRRSTKLEICRLTFITAPSIPNISIFHFCFIIDFFFRYFINLNTGEAVLNRTAFRFHETYFYGMKNKKPYKQPNLWTWK